MRPETRANAREAAFLLLRYIEQDGTFEPPRTLVGPQRLIWELGSGVGTAGIAAARALRQACSQEEAAVHGSTQPQEHTRASRGPAAPMQSTVVLTGLPDVCPLLRRNAASADAHPVQLLVRPLPWGSAAAASAIQADVGIPTHILCSDLVYFPELLAPLLRTLLDITRQAPEAEVIMGYKVRSLTKEQPFWTAFGAWFDFAPVLCTEHAHNKVTFVPFGSRAAHLAHTVPADADGCPLDDYFLLVAHRKAATLAWAPPASDAQLLAGCYDTGHDIISGQGTDAFEWMLMCRAADS